MDYLLTIATSADERTRGAQVAVLPVGSFEQHGDYLPLITDTVIACLIASEIAVEYDLMVLPPITMSCSHEHAAWPGTISISARTLHRAINDIADSAALQGIRQLLIVNAHGGNYVLANIVQEANIGTPRMALYPSREDWEIARRFAGMTTVGHDDMHAGELEVSILLARCPSLVLPGWETSDHDAPDRPLMLTLGMRAYAPAGVIGRPSRATADKGDAVLESLRLGARVYLAGLSEH